MGSRSVIVFVVVALGVLVAAQAPTNVEQGYLEIHHIDNFAAGVASRDFYFVSKDRKERVPLNIGPEGLEKVNSMRSGEDIEIEHHGRIGDRSFGNKPVQIRSLRSARDERNEAEAHGNDGKRQTAVALPPYSPNSKGTFNLLYIMLSWPEYKINATACSKANTLKYHGAKIQAPYKAFSFNQLNIVSVDVRTNSGIAYAGPFTLKTTAYNCEANIGKYKDEAFAMARAAGIDPAKYKGVIMGFPKHDFKKCTDQVAIGAYSDNQALVWNWLTECSFGDGSYNWHELGHGMRLSHAMYGTIEYGDQTATMGSAYNTGIHNAPHMDLLGWLSNTQRIRIGKPIAKTTYYLGALARGGARPLVLSIGDHPFGLDDYAGFWYVSYRQAYGTYEKVPATSGFAGLQIHKWAAAAKTLLVKVLRTAGATIQLKIPQGGYANVTLVSFNSTTARVSVVFVGCGTCTAGLGATCGWVSVPGCSTPTFCGGCPQNGYVCNAQHKCAVLPPAPVAANPGAALYYPLAEPIQIVNTISTQTVSCKGRDGAFTAGAMRNYDFAWCTSAGGISMVPWWATALELVVYGTGSSIANQEYRVTPKARVPVQYADSIVWGQPGQVAAKQWTIRPNQWSFDYVTTGADNIIADVVGYWAEPVNGRGDLNGMTAGYGFVPLNEPVRMFSTAAFPSSAYNIGRQIRNGERIPINISLSGIPATVAAVSGVMHADAATGANRMAVYGGPRLRVPPTLGQSAFNPGRETADSFLAPTWGSGFINIFQNAGGGAELALDAFGYFEQSTNALGLYYFPAPLKLHDSRTTAAFAAGEVRNFLISGQTIDGVAVSADTAAVAVMITAVVGPAGSKTQVRVYPGPATNPAPAAYVLSAQGGIIQNNGVHVRLGADGSLNVKSDAVAQLVVYITAIFKPAYPGANFAGTYIRAEAPSASTSSSSHMSSTTIVVLVAVAAVVVVIVAAIVVVIKKRRAAANSQAASPYALYQL